ncbi:hypothetical protein JOC34_003309 [Virgibacillus halotolerans]|nr:hypothetical protein [Virgibacillus halotolerans]
MIKKVNKAKIIASAFLEREGYLGLPRDGRGR